MAPSWKRSTIRNQPPQTTSTTAQYEPIKPTLSYLNVDPSSHGRDEKYRNERTEERIGASSTSTRASRAAKRRPSKCSLEFTRTVTNRRGIAFLGTPNGTRGSRVGRDKALILNFDFSLRPSL